MPDFKIIEVEETPYFYVDRSCSMDPEDISRNMGFAFQQVWKFMELHNVLPDGPALSVYYSYNPDIMTFRSGFTVAHNDIEKASGDIKSDMTPKGRVLHFIHNGSYATLRNDYEIMMTYVQDQGLELGAPSWELYMNDPSQVAEDELITEVFAKLA